MQSKFLLSAAAFCAFSAAQVNIDQAAETRVANDIVSFITSLAANTEFQSDLTAIASAIPSSVLSQAQNNPDALASSLATATVYPAWVSAIPTPALNSLDGLLAKPIKAEDDVESLVAQPQVSSLVNALVTAIPTQAAAALKSDPEDFFVGLATANTLPSYLTKLAPPLQSNIASLVNQGLYTVAADLEATSSSSIRRNQTSGRASASGYRGSSVTKPIGATGATGIKPTATTCPSYSPVTVIVTVTSPSSVAKPPATSIPANLISGSPSKASTSTSSAAKPPATGVPANSISGSPSKASTSTSTSSTSILSASQPKSPVASTGLPKPVIASTGLPKPPTSTVSGRPSGGPSGRPSGKPSGSTGGFTNKPTGSPIAFTGAAAPMRTAGVAAAVLVAGVGGLFHV